jgi:putative colanic acid biosynthesis UDP-glucose lipid carrier transferase
MIRSREVGLFNAYAFASAVALTLCFWGCLLLFTAFGIRNLIANADHYFAYNLISIGGLLLQMYRTDSNQVNLLALDSAQNLRLSIHATLHVAAALTVMLVLAKDAMISRLFLLVYLAALPGALFAVNAIIPKLLSHAFFSGRNQLPTLLVGRPKRAGRIRHWLRRMEPYGIHVVGFLVDGAEDEPLPRRAQRIPVVGHAADLEGILQKIRIDTVVLVDIPQDQAVLDAIITATERRGVRLLAVNNLSEGFRHSLRYYRQFGTDFLAMREEPLQDPINRMAKRALDVAIALPAVVFLLPPLALLVAIIHRVQSPGPLFYRQTRAGIQNRKFEIFKFRSMHADNPDAARQATKNDERVFTLGRFLRQSSIDEIPQFLNVLRGEMSLVGPRPHMVEHNAQFARVLESYHIRAFVKPGLTGLAQVRGFRGEARTTEDIRKRVECDIEYIERWSLTLDMFLVIQTAWQILRPPKSAY